MAKFFILLKLKTYNSIDKMYTCIFLFIYLIGYKEGAALLTKIWSGIVNLILKNLKLSLVIFVGVIEILETFADFRYGIQRII